jgi:hypothetical protein
MFRVIRIICAVSAVQADGGLKVTVLLVSVLCLVGGCLGSSTRRNGRLPKLSRCKTPQPHNELLRCPTQTGFTLSSLYGLTMVKNVKTCVITICHLAHADVWRLTSTLLPKFVEADEYRVYVPSSEVEAFLSITDPAIQVLSEDSLGASYALRLKNAVDSAENVNRYGWYLQQFHKLEALRINPADRLVIWDADCVPVDEIKFFDSNNVPIYTTSKEHHRPYFAMIHRLLGLSRVQSQSFVGPGFPILRGWVEDFIREVEARNDGFTWFDAIISQTDLSLMSGFSEFETLGTWITNSHPDGWKTSKARWERLGRSRFGPAKDLTSSQVVSIGKRENLKVISFENWDEPPPASLPQSRKPIANGLFKKFLRHFKSR